MTGPLVWMAGPDLPSPRSEAAAAIAPDNAVLLLGGTSPAGSTLVPKLSPGAAAWTTAPALDNTRVAPGAVRMNAAGILVFGGYQGGEATDEVLRYDYSFGDSQDAGKLLQPRDHFAFAVDGSGRAFAFGGLGSSGQTLASAERFDSAADEWTEIAPLPNARSGACAVATTSGYIYVFGGSAAGLVRTNTFRYNIANDSWDEAASIPVGVQNAAVVLFGERVYVLGGVASTGTVSSVQVYDLTTGVWSFDTDLPAARSSHAAVLGSLGQIIVAGGFDAVGQSTASVYQSQRLNIPETAPVFTSIAVTAASLDRAYSYDVNATGNPTPTFALDAAPAGITIDGSTGLISWQPVAGQVGVHAVSVRASNRAGQTNQSFNIAVVADTVPPTPPTSLQVVAVGTNSVELSWSGATDANGIHHYNVYRQYRCGFRGIQRCYALVLSNVLSTSTTISGLPPLTSYNYAVRAFDSSGLSSPNSPLVSFKTLSPPVSFRYTFNGGISVPVSIPARSLLEIQLTCSANPAATFSIVSGPATMVLDELTDVVSWTPTPEDVGAHVAVFRAANSVGTADLTVPITVVADIPRLSVQGIPGAGGSRDAVAGAEYSARVVDASHTPSTYSLISAPTGMSIEPDTGLIHWLPTPDHAGPTTVTVQANNAAGLAELTFGFYTHFTGRVSDIVVTNLTDLHPVASWTAPSGTGADQTAGYEIVATSRYRSGRAWRTQRLLFDTSADTPMVELTGLTSGRAYKLYVNAVDMAGNKGLVNTNPVSFTPQPGVPSIGWTVSNANGGSVVIAGQEALVQLIDYNTNFGPTAFTVVSAPAGFVLDPVTGTGRWTPSAADVGAAVVTVRAINSIGPRDSTIGFPVYFSGPVLNAFATRAGDNGSASWNPPADNVLPVVSNRLTIHWQWNSRSYSRTTLVSGNNSSFALVPTGAVWHKGVTIAPMDASGHVGVSTPLIPYNGALPAELPPAEPAWIENIAIRADGTPCLDIGGVLGQTLQVEVSDDFILWEPLGELIIGGDGMVQFPDLAGKNLPSGYYRLKIP